MLFDQLVANGKSYDRAIDMVMEKCSDAFEHYIALYEVESAKEAYASYMSEAFVTTRREEDYLLDTTQATPGIFGRLIRILKEGWENLIRWIKAVIARIKQIFMKKQVEKKLSLIERACAKFPKLKNMKVEVPDPNPTFVEKIKNDLSMLKIKIKTGKSFAQIRQETEDLERRQIIAKKAAKTATITITVATALVLLKQYLDFRKIEGQITESSKAHLHTLGINDEMDNEMLAEHYKIDKISMMYESVRHFNIFRFIKYAPRQIFKAANRQKDLSGGNDRKVNDLLFDLGYEKGNPRRRYYTDDKMTSSSQTAALFGTGQEDNVVEFDGDDIEDEVDDATDYNPDDIQIEDSPVESAPSV